MQAGVFSGSITVVEGGKPLFRRAYGLANREWSVPNTPETRFRIGSVTKQFTAAAILRLVDEGRLRLDDPVSAHVPDLPESWSKVTARMLLNHSSGIPNLTALPDYPALISRIDRSPRAVVALLERETVLFPPGAGHEYSNTGYVLLACLIERITGQNAARYLGGTILAPLGLSGIVDGDPGAILARRAAGYAHAHGGWRNAPPLAAGVATGAGDLLASVDDLVAWDRALLAGRVMSPASLAAMTRDAGYGYGLGLYVGSAHGHRLWSHGGFVPGFTAIKDTYPDLGLTIVVLANTETAPAQTMSRGLAALYFGAPDPAQQVRIEARVLARYVGAYQVGPRQAATVTMEGERLFLRLPGQPRLALEPESDRSFVARATGTTRITFDIEPDGRPTGALLSEQGRERAGPRIDADEAARRAAGMAPRNLTGIAAQPSPSEDRTRR